VIDKITRRLIIFGIALVLAGCASIQSTIPVTGNTAAEHCLAFYDDLDQVVAEHGVTPSRPERIAGFPYLRMTRFLASYSRQDLNGSAVQSWLAHLADLDQQARLIELTSLQSSVKSELSSTYDPDLKARLESCARTLVATDLASPERLALLRKRAVTTSEYRLLNQILGLYPLASIPVRVDVHQYHDETMATYAQPLETLPVRGQLHRFHAPTPIDAVNLSAMVAHDALGIPMPTASQLQSLFTAHAPIWEIDVVNHYDLPGKPFWHDDGRPDVDHSRALVYRYPSYTHWQGQVLLQLNYLIWFAERPRTGKFDIFSGKLDGLLWRVTLNTDGTVLIYDSMHACGCYHYFFPTTTLMLRPETQWLSEPPLLPQLAPQLTAGQKLVLRVSSGSHYIQRLYADTPSGQALHWREYRELYATPVAGGGHRSLFRRDGLVAGSARLERWLLWPMGILSAGAMRERGRQATAFVGHRHFDDADLLDGLFEPVSERVR
jgi:hypothetical protein